MPEPKINILLVDDRPENLMSLSLVLDSPDYRLVTAESGPQALRCLMQEDFAIILLDVQMPVMDGFETASLIRGRDRTRYVPIIFITAISKDEPFVYKGYDAGAVDYITKPYEPSILRSKVAVFAELYRKGQQIKLHEEQLRHRALAELELQALKRQHALERRYQDLVETIPNAVVWVADPKTLTCSFMSSKAATLLGFPSPRLWENPALWAELLHPEERERILEKLSAGTDRNVEISFEHQFLRPDGRVVWLHTAVRRIDAPEAEGGAELRGLSVDVTHLKNAEAEARKAISARDEFISIASHELKTPLTALQLQADLLARSAAEKAPEFVAKRVKPLKRQVQDLSELVNNLLDVTKMAHGQLRLELHDLELGGLVRDVAARFEPETRARGCDLKLDIQGEIRGRWDRLRIEQVFSNLLSNAIKYGGGSPVEIKARGTTDLARVSITDYGIGIPKEDHSRIFSRFERAAPESQFSGLGLGLYIVSKVLEAHGGRVQLDSASGAGSTFTVELPLQPESGHHFQSI